MKATCPISGISYTLPAPVRGTTIAIHPMVAGNIKVADLKAWYFKDWQDGKLDDETTHLLGIALLCKLPIESIAIEPVSATQLPQWVKLWSANLERLEYLATKLEGKVVKFRRLPRVVVSMATIHLLPEWIKTLNTELGLSSAPITDKAKELNRAAYAASSEIGGRTLAGVLEKEEIDSLVTRALKGSPLSTSESKVLPVILADWACKVTDFPSHSRVTWQRAIQIIFAPDYINQILMSDINVDKVKALEEHLILETPSESIGTSHSSLLMKRISEVIPVLEDFNPTISRRRKVDEGSLVDALMGSDGKESESGQAKRAPGKASSSESVQIPGGSLMDKLRARLGR